MKNNISSQNKKEIFLYLFPALTVFFLVIICPVIISLILSFYDFTGFETNFFNNFVGFKNFVDLFENRIFYIAIRNTAYFVLAGIIVQVSAAMLIAILIFFGNFKYSFFLRIIIFFPSILSPVAISLVWKKIFEQNGILNTIFHIDYAWLANVNLAIFIIIFVNIWQFSGYNMVIFYAGLQSIDKNMLEASDIDGATWYQKITKIVIPSLKPVIILNVILNLVGSFRAFDIIYVMTKGGPIHSSEVLTTLMYYYSFGVKVGLNKMGIGSAIAFIMFLIMIIFGIFRIRILKKETI